MKVVKTHELSLIDENAGEDFNLKKTRKPTLHEAYISQGLIKQGRAVPQTPSVI
jgi:hypothetical protein